jgi:putative membrane protein
MMGYGGWLVGLITLVLLLLIIGGLVAAVVWFASRRTNGQGLTNASNEDSALEILRKRYAKGEISAEEFETMREHLRS